MEPKKCEDAPMYENLPDKIKKQVLFFLQEEDDFVSAKAVYDAWFRQSSRKKTKTTEQLRVTPEAAEATN